MITGNKITETRIDNNVDVDTLRYWLARAIERRGFIYSLVPEIVYDDEPLPKEVQGSTDGTTRTVQVRNDMTPWETTRTTAHELAHIVLGHEDQASFANFLRILSGGPGYEEVDSELTSFGILSIFGLQDEKVTSEYVAGWAQSVGIYDPDDVDPTTAKNAALVIAQELIMDSFFSNFA